MGRDGAARYRPLQNERGAILAISLILLCILAIAGAMAYQMTASELQIAGNFAANKEAFYGASAGVEEARTRLALPGTDPNAVYDPATSPNTAWTAYILATTWQTSDDRDYSPSDTNYFPHAGSQTNTSITANSLQSDLEYWVKIRHKTEGGNIVYYGYQNPFSSLTLGPFPSPTATEFRPVEIIIGRGVWDKGRSAIRVEAAHDPGPPIVAALYGEWDIDGLVDASSPLSVTGDTSKSPPIYAVYIYPSGVDYRLDDSNPSATLPSIQTGNTNINIPQGITSLKRWKTSATASDCYYNSNYSICLHTGDLTVTGAIGTGIAR